MIQCAECGAIKRDVNHWILLWLERDGRRFCAVPFEEDPAMQREAGVSAVCGHGCATKSLAKWMYAMRFQEAVCR